MTILGFTFCMNLSQHIFIYLFILRPAWKSSGAECAPVNEILVISIAHCLLPSASTALLCIRQELSVSLVLKESNGTEPTKFHRELP